MFDSLEDEMEREQGRGLTKWNRVVGYAGVLLMTGILFGALYMGIRVLE